MAQLVECYDGSWINLDEVARIERIKETKRYNLITKSAEERKATIGFDPALLRPPLPALPGEALFEFYATSTERRPASFDDIVMIETPILGWYPSLPRAKPVTYRPYIDRGASMYLYRMADGRFNDEWGSDAPLKDLDAAKAYVLKRIQSHFT